jgi:hypothetical protein
MIGHPLGADQRFGAGISLFTHFVGSPLINLEFAATTRSNLLDFFHNKICSKKRHYWTRINRIERILNQFYQQNPSNPRPIPHRSYWEGYLLPIHKLAGLAWEPGLPFGRGGVGAASAELRIDS